MESLVVKPEKPDTGHDVASDVPCISVRKPKEADESIEPLEDGVARPGRVS